VKAVFYVKQATYSFRRLIGSGCESGKRAAHKPTFVTRSLNSLDFAASSIAAAFRPASRAGSGGGGGALIGFPLVKVAPLLGRFADIR
jgi:hypothetical protein